MHAVNVDSQRRQDWLTRVKALADQVEEWAKAEGWPVDRQQKVIREEALGEYTVPLLRVQARGGELHLNPIGLHIIGGNGRVDIEAYPTLGRVKLIGDNGGWKLMVDNVPLRRPWAAHTFVELAQDLLS